MYMLQLLRQWSRKSGNWKEDLPQYHCCVLTKKVAKLSQTSWGPQQDHDLIGKIKCHDSYFKDILIRQQVEGTRLEQQRNTSWLYRCQPRMYL